MVEIIYGKSRPFHDQSVEDLLAYPIWVWALDEEGVEGQDETWVKPMINVTDMEDHKESMMTSSLMLFRVLDTPCYGIGTYACGYGELEACELIGDRNDNYHDVVKAISYPAIFEALPTIGGKAGVRFLCPEEGGLCLMTLKRIN